MTERKGWGVFATEKIFQYEIIEECHLIPLPIKVGQPSNLLVDYRFNWPHSGECLEQVIVFGYGCIYNHSNEPNASWRDHPNYKAFQFVALRDIEPGEEICTFYGGSEYWEDGGRDYVELV